MFDIGWTELLLIGIVTLIVVGPKELPGMFRTMGRFTAKARGMAREFQRAMDDAAKETGIDETARDLRDMTSKKNLGLDALDKAASSFEKWDPVKTASKKHGDSGAAKVATQKAATEATGSGAAKSAGADQKTAATGSGAKSAGKTTSPAAKARSKAAPKTAKKAAAAKGADAKPAAPKARPKTAAQKPASARTPKPTVDDAPRPAPAARSGSAAKTAGSASSSAPTRSGLESVMAKASGGNGKGGAARRNGPVATPDPGAPAPGRSQSRKGDA